MTIIVMNKHIRIFALFMAFAMLFTLIPTTARAEPPEPPELDVTAYSPVTPSASVISKDFNTEQAKNFPYSITGKSAAAIKADLQTIISASLPGDIISVNGTKNNENAVIGLNIPADISLLWAAESKNLSFDIGGGGVFEVAAGGVIEVTGKDAIVSSWGKVVVSGGEVSVLRSGINDWEYRCAIRITGVGEVIVTGGRVSAYRNASAVYLEWGDVTVKGGELSVTGETTSNGISTNGCYTIRIENMGTAVITGGKVISTGAVHDNHVANIGWGLIACLEGTLESDAAGADMFGIWYWWYGAAVIVNNGIVPVDKTQTGMTVYGGSIAVTNVFWDTADSIPLIRFDFNGYEYSVPWVIPDSPGGPVYPHSVELYDGATPCGVFDTLNDAVAEANRLGLGAYELKVVGDVAEPDNVTIDKDVTIIGDGHPRIVTLATGTAIYVKDNGKLTVGDGIDLANLLTISGNYYAVVVTDGTVSVNDGVTLKSQSSSGTALLLSGTDAKGSISGGRFEGGTCLALEKGAQLSGISGGRFIGKEYAVYLTDTDTMIGEISDGFFYQTESFYGHVVLVQNKAEIGKISNGYFEAVRGVALTILRGAVVGEISGGEFTAPPTGTISTNGWNAAVWIQNGSATSETGINLISGGHFYGSHFGVITMTAGSYAGSYIGEVSDGLFEGIVGLQNDVRGTIGTISGGEFIASQGMLNVGTINEIKGTAYFLGKSSYGIFNYYTNSSTYGVITEIGGDTYFEGRDYGIANSSRIDLISNGTYIGLFSAINCDGLNKGSIGTIENGVFWGKNNSCIRLSYRNAFPNQLKLEPVLGSPAIDGIGRYQAGNGLIFNEESYVDFPIYDTQNTYRMSKDTDTKPEPLTNLYGPYATEFRYLTFYNTVTVEGSFATPNGGGEYKKGETVNINAGSRTGYTFTNWTVDEGEVTLDDDMSNTTYFDDMPAESVKVTAHWTMLDYIVTVNNSFATPNGEGRYSSGDPVDIDAGTHPLGEGFVTWITDDGVIFDNASAEFTSFTMLAKDVTVNAVWTNTLGVYIVEVMGSYEPPPLNGAGGYFEGSVVSIDAGSPPTGLTFAYWYTNDGVVFADPTSPTTTFTMPAKNVRVTAIWAFRPSFYTVRVEDSYASPTGAGGYRNGDGVDIHAGIRTGYSFDGWDVLEGGATLTSLIDTTTDFTMPAENVTVQATWEPLPLPVKHTVTVLGSYAAVTGAGYYKEDEIVYIFAGSRSGYTFTGWTVNAGTISTFIPDQNSETTSFTMPGENVTVTANWRYDGGGGEPPPSYSASFRISKELVDEDGRTTGNGLEFFVVIYERTGPGIWERIGQYTVPANGYAVVIPNIEGGKTYQIVEMTNGWYNVLGYRVSIDSVAIGAASGVAVALNVPVLSSDMTVDVVVSNVRTGEPGGTPGGGEAVDDPPFIELMIPQTPLSPFKPEHLAYIAGYPDGNVEPTRNITRAEVATIFFRLLVDDVLDDYWTQENPFPDVQRGMWHNNAISVMNSMGIVKGNPDGTFKPSNPITRAEFAAIAARFARIMQMSPMNDLRFSDVGGHWAEEDIFYAAAVGWINGFPDGTFRPNQSITRAEAMTLVNRMLRRVPESVDDLLIDEMNTWPDNADTGVWFYLAVQEATNSHVPAFKDKAVPGLQFNYEYWVAMIPDRDWAALERNKSGGQ